MARKKAVQAGKDAPVKSSEEISDAKARSRANLKAPWPKGKSGNPNGRPKGSVSLTTLLKKTMAEVLETDPKRRTWLQIMVEKTLLLAAKGNATALKEIWERIDGKVKDEIEVGGQVRVVRIPVRAKSVKDWTSETRGDSGMGTATGSTDGPG